MPTGQEPSPKPPSAAQVLAHMLGYYAAHGVLPSAQSIKDSLKFTGKSTVMRRIRELEAEGQLLCIPYGTEGKGGKVRIQPTQAFLQSALALRSEKQISPSPPAISEPGATLMGRAVVDPPRHAHPMAGANVTLGFPSSAEDFVDGELDLNELLGTHLPSVFFYRARGDSMVGVGIFDGDILAVDRSITVSPGDIVLAYWESNNAVCKIYRPKGGHVELHSAAPDHPPIVLSGDIQVEMFVVTSSIKQFGRHRHNSRAH
jgi:DNA polymerase V